MSLLVALMFTRQENQYSQSDNTWQIYHFCCLANTSITAGVFPAKSFQYHQFCGIFKIIFFIVVFSLLSSWGRQRASIKIPHFLLLLTSVLIFLRYTNFLTFSILCEVIGLELFQRPVLRILGRGQFIFTEFSSNFLVFSQKTLDFQNFFKKIFNCNQKII